MKHLLFFLIFSLLPFSLSSFTQNDIQVFTLENGLKIYFLEDASSPTVRAELCINAGFTNQSRENSSLFHLYARLAHGEISSDCVRFVADTAPSSAEKALLNLSRKLKTVRPTDSELSQAFNFINQELEEYSKSTAGFINAAIDSKIFPQNPWTRESGSDWKAFRQKSNNEIRAQLQSISDTYYIPANAKLFVNGNITQTALLAIVKKYFSTFTGRPFEPPADEDAKIVHEELKKSLNQKSGSRKFLLVHKDFSDEMTQIVLQYKNISSDEADVLASSWNRDGADFKKILTNQKELNILGDEYIDVSSAQEKNSSRLIIQSLLGMTQLSPVAQADLFLSASRNQGAFSKEEIQAALKEYQVSFLRLSESSSETMQAFSRFISLHEGKSSDLLADFFSREKIYSEIDIPALHAKINGEEPYVFLLVNTTVFQKYEKDFKKAGFQIINQNESRWFDQAFYKKLLKEPEKKSAEKKTLLEEIAFSAQRFISNSLSDYSFFKLRNKIPVTIKENKSSNTAVLSITIAGGQLLFAKKAPGLAEVLTGSIAVNIRKQLALLTKNNAIKGYYTVNSETKATHSIITVTCFAKEIDFAIQAAYTALVYCDISPVTADGVTYDERSHWRLKSGSTTFQLLCEAMRLLYKGSEYPSLYQDTKDKPDESLNFMKILESYPILLDSSRISLIITCAVNAD
ncbi:MAG: insulinase family protein, partial [Treponema sp.]|nr:insulinase family protein [Treponema sp.]